MLMEDLGGYGGIKKIFCLGWYQKAILIKMDLCNEIIRGHMLRAEVFLGEYKQVQSPALRLLVEQPKGLPIVEMNILNFESLLTGNETCCLVLFGEFSY